MTDSINYVEAQFIFIGRRKHLLKDQKYYVSIFAERILIGKKKNDQSPKYTLALNLKQQIHWVTVFQKQKFKIEAFGFKYGIKYKNFHADHDSLEKMRKIISCIINFSKVADFYSPEFIIGIGSSARVFQCKRVSDNKPFAIKAINKDYLEQSDQGKLAFETEVSILRLLTQKKVSDSQYFINLYEVFEGDVTYYLITDLMKGQTLQDEIHIHKGQYKILSNKIVTTIIRRILEGVKVMHESQIIHRDLKPQNIMFEQPGQYDTLKIVDFGLATKQNVDEYLFPKCGTPGYVAPEVLNSNNKKYLYSEVCDIFSIGVIFYKLLTGKVLFEAENVEQTLKLNKRCDIDFNGGDFARIDKFSLQLLRAMLVKNPLQRVSAKQALKFEYFTGNNTQPHTALIQPHIAKTSISTILPLIDLKFCEVVLSEQVQKVQGNQREYSPFGNVCKGKSFTRSKFDPRQSREAEFKKVDINKSESKSSSKNSMDEHQGLSPIKINQLPTLKRSGSRSKSSQLRENIYTLSPPAKKRSLITQFHTKQFKSFHNGTSSDIQQNLNQKVSYANISSFYMKDPLSVLIKHQQQTYQLPSQNSSDEIKINQQQMQQSQQESLVQEQKNDFNQKHL